jgi:hypothetical protein
MTLQALLAGLPLCMSPGVFNVHVAMIIYHEAYIPLASTG